MARANGMAKELRELKRLIGDFESKKKRASYAGLVQAALTATARKMLEIIYDTLKNDGEQYGNHFAFQFGRQESSGYRSKPRFGKGNRRRFGRGGSGYGDSGPR